MDRLNVKTIAQNFTAGQTVRFGIAGAYMRLISAAGTVSFEYWRNDVSIGTADNFLAGLAVEELPFDAITIKVGTDGAYVFVIADSKFSYDRAAGSVDVLSLPAVPWSGAPQVTIANEVEIKNDSGNPLLVAFNTAPKVIQDGQSYGASFKSNSLLVTNTAQQVVAPASNVNGIVITSANILTRANAANPTTSLIAKASAPTSTIDGDVLLSPTNAATMGADGAGGGCLELPITVPAGLGLYFISSVSEVSGLRNVLYTLK